MIPLNRKARSSPREPEHLAPDLGLSVRGRRDDIMRRRLLARVSQRPERCLIIRTLETPAYPNDSAWLIRRAARPSGAFNPDVQRLGACQAR
jgi:hypothetical protein